MSLVGSLEDLGLGEILQIVSLSGKSGVLWVRSRHGEGHVVFSRGLIRGAFVKDGPKDLRDLVATAGVLPAEQLQTLENAARDEGAPLEALLCARTSLDAGCIDELRGRHVEETVLRMFGWLTGEFSFEIRDEPRGGDIAEELLLRTGLNAQFLALEGTRLRDEGAGGEEPAIGGEPDEDDETSFADVAGDDDHEVVLTADDEFEAEALPAGLDDEDAPLAAPVERAAVAPIEPVRATVAPIEAELLDEAAPTVVEPPASERSGVEGPAELQITVLELVDEQVDGADLPAVLPGSAAAAANEEEETTLSAGLAAAAAAATPAPAPRPAGLPSHGQVPVVVSDRELVVLEWVKRALAPLPVRVHIFQRSEQAITRIRQYVARGELPLVLLTTGTPPDPVSGARDWAQIAARLRAQVPSLPLVLLAATGASVSPANERAIPDALATRPDLTTLSDERARERRETLAGELRGALERAYGRTAPREAAPAARDEPGDALRGLREVSARLRDPSSRGDVLRLVLDYAARTFDRVAIFAVRDGEAFGVAQSGLPGAGGPDDVDLRRIHFSADETSWLRKVLESRAPVRAAPGDDGDRDLASRLGNAVPPEVYVAPIESGERIAAVLYADNLVTRRPLGDTSALEVVLHEAGLALERAVLERALEQAEGDRASAAAEPDPF
jgi:hypothetical protein